MAQFDLIIAAGKAYQTSWLERGYLLRLVIAPFFAKALCYLLAFSYGFQGNPLALTLCLVPAYFLEGWMLSHYVRLLTLGHRWPFQPTGDLQADLPVLRRRARGVMAGTLSYVLINMALGGMIGTLTQIMPAPDADPSTVPPGIALSMIPLMILMIWGFRFIWTYIPIAANIDARLYAQTVRGYLTSFPLIGLWLICIIPFVAAQYLVGGLLHSIFAQSAGEQVGSFVLILAMVVFDLLKNLVATAGITYAFLEMLQKQGQADHRS